LISDDKPGSVKSAWSFWERSRPACRPRPENSWL